MEHEGSLPY